MFETFRNVMQVGLRDVLMSTCTSTVYLLCSPEERTTDSETSVSYQVTLSFVFPSPFSSLNYLLVGQFVTVYQSKLYY